MKYDWQYHVAWKRFCFCDEDEEDFFFLKNASSLMTDQNCDNLFQGTKDIHMSQIRNTDIKMRVEN